MTPRRMASGANGFTTIEDGSSAQNASPIRSVVWTRQRRHNEVIQAASSPTARRPKPADPPDPTARLAEIEELKASGAISADEYAQARKRIFDELCDAARWSVPTGPISTAA